MLYALSINLKHQANHMENSSKKEKPFVFYMYKKILLLFHIKLSIILWKSLLLLLRKRDANTQFEVEKPGHLNSKSTSSVFIIKAPFRLEVALTNPEFSLANTHANKYYVS